MQLLFWLIVLSTVSAAAALLAFKSLSDYYDIPEGEYAVFYVGNPNRLTVETLEKLFDLCNPQKAFFSLERLMKGEDFAFAIFGPKFLVKELPEAGLIELEDYVDEGKSLDENLKVAGITHSFVFSYTSNGSKLALKDTLKKVYSEILLGEEQRFYFQIVCMPSKERNTFQITLRGMVIEKNASERLKLAKIIDSKILEKANVLRHKKFDSSTYNFRNYKKRAAIPAQVKKCTATSAQILQLLGLD